MCADLRERIRDDVARDGGADNQDAAVADLISDGSDERFSHVFLRREGDEEASVNECLGGGRTNRRDSEMRKNSVI